MKRQFSQGFKSPVITAGSPTSLLYISYQFLFFADSILSDFFKDGKSQITTSHGIFLQEGIYLTQGCHLTAFCCSSTKIECVAVSVCVYVDTHIFWWRQEERDREKEYPSTSSLHPLPHSHLLCTHAIRSITMIIGFGGLHYYCCLSRALWYPCSHRSSWLAC